MGYSTWNTEFQHKLRRIERARKEYEKARDTFEKEVLEAQEYIKTVPSGFDTALVDLEDVPGECEIV